MWRSISSIGVIGAICGHNAPVSGVCCDCTNIVLVEPVSDFWFNGVMSTFQEELVAKLDALEDLPTLSSIVQELERLLHSDTVSMEEVALVIEEDPAIATAVLRVANSVVYFSSMSGRIVSLRDALVRLGTQEVHRLVSASAIIQAFGKLGHHLDATLFWRQSLRTAVCLRMMARAAATAYIDEDESYMAGLLHDIGLLVLDQYFPEVYEGLQAKIASQSLSGPEVERAELGLDHGQVGGCLLEQWNLPAELVEAVAWHNQPDQADADARFLASAVQIAELINDLLEAEDKTEDKSEELTQIILGQPFWEEMGFGAEDIAGVIEETRKWSTPVFALM